MNLSIRNALYIAGTILVASAIVSQFQKADLIWSTLMVIVAIGLLLWGYRKEKQRLKCAMTKNRKKIWGVTLGMGLVFVALGFSIGKLLYLWTH